MAETKFGAVSLAVGATVIAALLLAGCGGPAPAKKVEVAEQFECVWPDAPDQQAPTWVCDLPYKTYQYTAVGSFKSAQKAHAKNMATNMARVNLASTMRVHVKRMVKNYVSTTGSGDDETVDQVSTDVSKSLTQETLFGVRPLISRTSPTGTIYVLVGMDADTGREATRQALRTSMGNQRAAWQRALGKQSQAELDAELDKLNNQQSGPVTPRTVR